MDQEIIRVSRSVTALASDERFLYLANLEGDVLIYDLEKKTISKSTFLSRGGKVKQLHLDAQKRLWVLGNPRHGPIRWDGGSTVVTFQEEGVKDIRVMAEKAGGNTFFGGNHPEHIGRFPENTNVLAIDQDGKNNTWLSASEGLVLLTKDQQLVYDFSVGIPGRNLSPRGLAVDERGYLWVGASRGLGLLRRDRNSSGFSAPPTIQSVLVNGVPYKGGYDKPFRFRHGDNLAFRLFSPMFPARDILYEVML